MKYIIAYGLIIIMIFLTSCEKEPPPLPSSTSENASKMSSEIENPTFTIEEISVTEENITTQSTEPIEFTEPDTTNNDDDFYPFAEDEWIRETVEEFRRRTQEFEEILEKYSVSQSNGNLVYTTDFDKDVIIYRHPDNNYIFTGKSFGSQFGMGCITISDNTTDYSIDANRILDIFAYENYIYYIWTSEWFSGIKRLTYIDGQWIDDENFKFIPVMEMDSEYSEIRKAYADEDKVYIISSNYIYSFNGVELTPILFIGLEKITYSVYSVTKIGDIFYIGSEGFIAECNIVTGEEYIWTKSP